MSPSNFYIYNKSSNIKESLFTKLELPVNTEIKSVEDISKIQQAFGKIIPYDNSDLIVNNVNLFDDEYCIKRIIEQSLGGTCLHITIVMGLLLTEFGFDVQLTRGIKSEKSLSDLVQYHYANIVTIDGKRYLVDASMGVFNSYIPIELGASEPVVFLTTSYRAIQTEDGSYSFEQKRIQETEYTTTYKFFDKQVEVDAIAPSQVEYRNHPHCNLLLFIMCKDGGHYMLMKNCLTTVTNFAAPTYKPIADDKEYKEILSTSLNYNVELNPIDFFSVEVAKQKQESASN